ncbi:Glutamate decarboxylase 2 [Friedmanniomyces endolithicus]|nr:Glutamate decarboxylase 2 [Friedmanniomyces endolithicus]
MTVLGSFDPPDASADVCEKRKLWLQIDGSWGGPVVFSEKQRHKLAGSHPADTIALCPHKMMSVPLTCTCLLGNDLRKCHKGMTLPAGYLSHTAEDGDDANDHDAGDIKPNAPEAHPQHQHHDKDIYDLADLTPQCGRRGDSLR